MDRSGVVVAAALAGVGYWMGGTPGTWVGLFLFGILAAIDAVHRWISSLRTQLDLHGMALDRIQEQLVEVRDLLQETKDEVQSVQCDVERTASDVNWLCKQVRDRSDVSPY